MTADGTVPQRAEVERVAEAIRSEFVGQGASDTTWEDYEHEARAAIAAMDRTAHDAVLTQLAKAWDEGRNVGDPYHRRGNPETVTNPYRADALTTTTEGAPE